MWRGLPLAEKVGVCRQTRVAEATPSRSSRSRRDKPQGLAPFPATGQAEVWGTSYLWRVRDAGHSRLRSRISKLAFLFVRVGDELSACGRWSDRLETLSSRPKRSQDRLLCYPRRTPAKAGGRSGTAAAPSPTLPDDAQRRAGRRSAASRVVRARGYPRQTPLFVRLSPAV